jgi:FtsP/CotA-like multicopper oxidase with cupredoxin domain
MDSAQSPDRRSSRRRWYRRLRRAGVGLAVLLVIVGAGLVWVFQRATMSNVGELSFENELRIPELVEGERGADGVTRFDLEIAAGSTTFKDGAATETWGVNGSYLGPTLRASRGDEVEVSVTNDVEETTTVHWHGMHLPARMDGGPHQPVPAGETWTPTWRIDQPAATLWYHPHLHGTTAEHVYRGVAGMFILDDDQAAGLDLPSEYGVDDIPLIVQDRSFGDDGQFDFSAPMMSSVGVLGDEILVNGTYDPHVEVVTERVRLRVLNASNSRFYDIGFVDDRPFQLIGTDGGLLPAPATTTRVPLSPGERAEIVVDFDPGEEVVLRSFAPDLGAGFWNERFNGGDDTFDLVEFQAADELAPSPLVPDELVPLESPDVSDVEMTRPMRLSSRRINGEQMDMDRIDEVVVAGSTEVWEVENDAGIPHNFHVHDVQFVVLDVDGEPPPVEMSGWKDTVAMRPGSTARLLIRFGSYTDPDFPYMFHCHLLTHEDAGMMGQFVVVEPGQQPGRPPPSAGHDHD